jgi:hypothetical protein
MHEVRSRRLPNSVLFISKRMLFIPQNVNERTHPITLSCMRWALSNARMPLDAGSALRDWRWDESPALRAWPWEPGAESPTPGSVLRASYWYWKPGTENPALRSSQRWQPGPQAQRWEPSAESWEPGADSPLPHHHCLMNKNTFAKSAGSCSTADRDACCLFAITLFST